MVESNYWKLKYLKYKMKFEKLNQKGGALIQTIPQKMIDKNINLDILNDEYVSQIYENIIDNIVGCWYLRKYKIKEKTIIIFGENHYSLENLLSGRKQIIKSILLIDLIKLELLINQNKCYDLFIECFPYHIEFNEFRGGSQSQLVEGQPALELQEEFQETQSNSKVINDVLDEYLEKSEQEFKIEEQRNKQIYMAIPDQNIDPNIDYELRSLYKSLSILVREKTELENRISVLEEKQQDDIKFLKEYDTKYKRTNKFPFNIYDLYKGSVLTMFWYDEDFIGCSMHSINKNIGFSKLECSFNNLRYHNVDLRHKVGYPRMFGHYMPILTPDIDSMGRMTYVIDPVLKDQRHNPNDPNFWSRKNYDSTKEQIWNVHNKNSPYYNKNNKNNSDWDLAFYIRYHASFKPELYKIKRSGGLFGNSDEPDTVQIYIEDKKLEKFLHIMINIDNKTFPEIENEFNQLLEIFNNAIFERQDTIYEAQYYIKDNFDEVYNITRIQNLVNLKNMYKEIWLLYRKEEAKLDTDYVSNLSHFKTIFCDLVKKMERTSHEFIGRVIFLMDYYTLLRMFVKFDFSENQTSWFTSSKKNTRGPVECREKNSNNIIFHGGSAHSTFYSQFIEKFFNIKPILKTGMDFEDTPTSWQRISQIDSIQLSQIINNNDKNPTHLLDIFS